VVAAGLVETQLAGAVFEGDGPRGLPWLDPDWLGISGRNSKHDLIGLRVEVLQKEGAGVNLNRLFLDAQLATALFGESQEDAT
jgi:hypothetical protein